MLFVFAGACRLISSLILSSQYFDPQWNREPKLGFRASWKVFWANKSKRQFFFYLVPFQAAVFVSSPFVTPYMLAQVKMDYGTYMAAIGILFIGKVMALTMIERFRGSASGVSLFMFGASAIVPLPALWAFSSHVYFIFFLQLLSGLAWAFVEVGLSLIFFKDLKHEEKIPVLMVYNLLNSVAIILGTFVGGKFLWFFGEKISSYYMVFILGSVSRAAGFLPLYLYTKSQVFSFTKSSTLPDSEKAS